MKSKVIGASGLVAAMMFASSVNAQSIASAAALNLNLTQPGPGRNSNVEVQSVYRQPARQQPSMSFVPFSTEDGLAIVEAWKASELPNPPDLSQAVALLTSSDSKARTQASTTLSAAAQSLAMLEHGAIRDPHALDLNWALRGPYDPAYDFYEAHVNGQLANWLTNLPRKDATYLNLLAERRRYQTIADQGGWPTVSKSVGLQSRLAVEGYSDVRDFQMHHALAPTGEVDAETLAALNVPVTKRLAMIDANIERARWLPDQLPKDRIEVDIDGAETILFADDQAVLRMRAIVGKPIEIDKTPMFITYVKGVTFNPPWVPTPEIATKELLPKGRQYLAAHNFYIAPDGQLVQRAGPSASLGFVMFDMPNQFGVYLHDTHSSFENERLLSHGCVRVQMPRELAGRLLGWQPAQVDAVIATGVTKEVPLNAAMPVYMIYRTVEIASDSKAVFRNDIYGWDAKLIAAIK